MGIDNQSPDEKRLQGVHPAMNVALATPLFVLGGGIIVLFIARLVITIQHRRRLRAILQNDEQSGFTRESTLTAWLNKHVFYAPLFSSRHSNEFRLFGLHMGSIPLRFETGVVSFYLGVNFAFFVSLVDWWQNYQELLYQLKYASGHLAVMNLPGLLISAGRNNPLIHLLGIQFDTFNLLHRWIGRVICIGAIVHVACVAVSHVAQSGVHATAHVLWHVPFFVYGMVAFIGFVLIMIQSTSPLRHAFYEVFLHCHIGLAIMSFVGLWYHLRGLSQQYVLLATIILWGLERAARLASLIWRNIGQTRTTADIELLHGNVARVNVALARTWKFKAGQYMYLYIPSLGLWTSHPFSVAWTSTEEVSEADKRDSNDSFNYLLKEKGRTTVSFLIKGHNGFTSKLVRKAVESEERGGFRARAFAEGPFGGLHSFESFGTVLLIAGGIGITHPMSYMHEFMQGFAARSIAVRRVNLVWVTPSSDHLTWINPWMTTLFAHPALTSKESPALSLSIQLFITSKQPSEESVGETETGLWAFNAPANVNVNIAFGRPCFTHILETERARQVGAMAVSVCGKGSMGDAVRLAVRGAQGERKIELVEETFSW